jgi:indole-3-glycerol phosphate synthase
MKLTEAIKRAKKEGKIPLIAEIKVISPQDGNLLRGRDPVEIASQYLAGGAAAISIVTEESYFGGSLEILKKVREKTTLPILRKDFITTRKQLRESKQAGADAVLLICSILPNKRLKLLHDYAHTLGLQTVMEVHTQEELEMVKFLDLDILGINNKDILNLERDEDQVETTLSLLSLIPKEVILLSESGIRNGKEARTLIKAGVDALLMGTGLLKADNIAEKVREIVWLK